MRQRLPWKARFSQIFSGISGQLFRSCGVNHKSWSGNGLHFVLGAIVALALPPIGLWPAPFLALPWFIARLDNKSPFRAGWLFGFGYFCVALHWIGFAFLVDAKTYLWMMPFAIGGLAAFLALYWGLAAKAAAIASQRFGLEMWIGFPVFLSIAEYLRGHLFTGFPWAPPGLTADGMGGVVQLASVIGMTGLSFLILLWSAAVLPLMRKQSRFISLTILATLPLCWVWGEWRLSQSPTELVENATIRLVQPNVAQDEKWSIENAEPIFEALLEQSTAPATQLPTHIIWPESAVPFLIDESAGAQSRLAEALADNQILITGAIRRSAPNESADYYTSIEVFDGNGQLQSFYDKWRLVPGGEFLPFEWLLEPLGFKRLVTMPSGFRGGAGAGSLDIPGLGRAGPLICYEVIFPHNLVDPKRRPDWLLNVTNDGWFGKSVGPYQHLAQARMRAVEQGLPLLRAANTGISGSIDPVGRIIAQTKLGEKATINVPLAKPIDATPYARFGDLILLLLLAITVTALSLFSRVNCNRL
jgi:apolipoprotein N-acyltransferase